MERKYALDGKLMLQIKIATKLENEGDHDMTIQINNIHVCICQKKDVIVIIDTVELRGFI